MAPPQFQHCFPLSGYSADRLKQHRYAIQKAIDLNFYSSFVVQWTLLIDHRQTETHRPEYLTLNITLIILHDKSVQNASKNTGCHRLKSHTRSFIMNLTANALVVIILPHYITKHISASTPRSQLNMLLDYCGAFRSVPALSQSFPSPAQDCWPLLSV